MLERVQVVSEHWPDAVLDWDGDFGFGQALVDSNHFLGLTLNEPDLRSGLGMMNGRHPIHLSRKRRWKTEAA